MLSFEGLEVSGLLDTGAMKTFISRELIHQVPEHQVLQHTKAEKLQIQLLNCEEVQSKGKVALKANIEKLHVTFKVHILNITYCLILGMDFIKHFGAMLDYTNVKAAVSMTGCRYPPSLS